MQNLKELLSPTPIGVWNFIAVSKCGTALKFRKSNGAEVVVTVRSAQRWVQEGRCKIDGNQLIWDINKFDKPEF